MSKPLQIKPGSALDRKANEIARLYGEICSAARMSLGKAIKMGGILLDVHESPAFKGKWLQFLEQCIPFSQKTAWRYMGYYRHREKLVNLTNLSEADGLILALPDDSSRKKRRRREDEPESAIVTDASALESDGSADASTETQLEPEPQPQKRRKSQKQIIKELQEIADQEREAEIKANDQLSAVIEKLSNKIRAAWLELPGRLATHGKTLVELAERLRLNTPEHT